MALNAIANGEEAQSPGLCEKWATNFGSELQEISKTVNLATTGKYGVS